MIRKEDFKKIESFMMNKTRDLELAIYNGLLYGEDKIMVSYAMSMYQNNDGGFGHAIEPNNTCPLSSAISTLFALNILKMVGFNRNNLDEMTNEMIVKAMKYVLSVVEKKDYMIYPVNKETNQYPHAKWLEYSIDMIEKYNINPALNLYALVMYFAKPKTKFYDKAYLNLKKCIDYYLENKVDYQTIIGAINAYEVLINDGIIYKKEELKEKIISDIKTTITPLDLWNNNDRILPTDLIINKEFLTSDLEELYQASLEFLITSRTKIGVWDINYNWENEYEEDYEMARIKWQGYITVINIYTLFINGCVEEWME